MGAVAMRGAKTDVKTDGGGGIESYYEVRWRVGSPKLCLSIGALPEHLFNLVQQAFTSLCPFDATPGWAQMRESTS